MILSSISRVWCKSTSFRTLTWSFGKIIEKALHKQVPSSFLPLWSFPLFFHLSLKAYLVLKYWVSYLQSRNGWLVSNRSAILFAPPNAKMTATCLSCNVISSEGNRSRLKVPQKSLTALFCSSKKNANSPFLINPAWVSNSFEQWPTWSPSIAFAETALTMEKILSNGVSLAMRALKAAASWPYSETSKAEAILLSYQWFTTSRSCALVYFASPATKLPTMKLVMGVFGPPPALRSASMASLIGPKFNELSTDSS